jgi:hypothetical protein
LLDEKLEGSVPEHARRGRGVEFVKCGKCKRSVLDQAARCPWCDTPIGASGAGKSRTPSTGRGPALATIFATGLGTAALLVYLRGWLPAPSMAPPPRPPARSAPTRREEARFGLTEAQRRDVYQDILGAEDHAQLEADRRYPPPDPAASSERWQRYSEARDQFRKQAEDEDKKAIARRYGLTADQLAAIAKEAVQSSWPRPPRRSMR